MELRLPMGKDKLAVGLAAFTLLLLFVFFFALNRNVDDVAREIQELKALNAAVVELDARHATLDGRVADLGALPRRTRSMALENQIKAMSHATTNLDQQLSGRHSDKLATIRKLLDEIGDDLHTAK